MSVRKLHIGQVPVIAMSVSFSGELAYELHIPNASLLLVHDLLMQAGEAFGIGYFGLRAVESMRLEKGYLHWKSDIITEYNPFETGLDRFVRMDKEFIGKSALENMQANGPRRTLVTLELDSDTTPAHPGDSVMRNGKVVGTVTSAGWGYRVGKNLAYATVDMDAVDDLAVLVLANYISANIVEQSLYDPENKLVRCMTEA